MTGYALIRMRALPTILVLFVVAGCEGRKALPDPPAAPSARGVEAARDRLESKALPATSAEPLPRPSPLLATMRYQPIRERPSQPLGNETARADIRAWVKRHPDASLDEMIRFSLGYTSQSLTFVFDRAPRSPDGVLKTRTANCVGYSALFNAVFAAVVQERGLAERYRATHLVARITVAGKSVHGLVDSPFFRDHDYNRVLDRHSGEALYVDPSIHDYAGIVYVNSK